MPQVLIFLHARGDDECAQQSKDLVVWWIEICSSLKLMAIFALF